MDGWMVEKKYQYLNTKLIFKQMHGCILAKKTILMSLGASFNTRSIWQYLSGLELCLKRPQKHGTGRKRRETR